MGGGLDENRHWKDNGADYLFPIKAVSRVFRGKYLEQVKSLWKEEKLSFYGSAEKYRNHYVFQEMLDACYEKEWAPCCKKTFRNAETVIKYLGKSYGDS